MPDVFYLPYSQSEIPIAKVFEIGETDYTYQVEYNSNFDFYTLTVKDENDNIIYTAKLVYGNDALHAISPDLSPGQRLKPYNVIEAISDYNQDNFDKVKIYVID